MENDAIINYVLSQDVVEIPTVQQKFDLSYIETKSIIDFLAYNKKIEYISGVAYKVLAKNTVDKQNKQAIYDDDQERIIYKKALWECVKRQTVSIAVVQRELQIGFKEAGRAIEWMEDNGYVLCYPEKKVLLSETEYKKFFGDPNKPFKTENDLDFKFTVQSDYESDDDEDEDEECCYEFTDESVDDIVDCRDIEWNKRLTMAKEDLDKIMKSFSTEIIKEDKYDILTYKPRSESAFIDLQKMLPSCFMLGMVEKECGKEYAIAIDDDQEFAIKFVNEGELLKMSDGGCALSPSNVSKRRVKNVLKDYPQVELDGNEISITIDSPNDMLKALLKLYAAVDAVKKMQ